MVVETDKPVFVSTCECVLDSSMCFRYIYIRIFVLHCVRDVLTFLPPFSITMHNLVDQLRHYVSNILFELHLALWAYPALWMQNSRLIFHNQYSKFDSSALKSLIRSCIYPSAPYSHKFRTSCCHWALFDSSLFFLGHSVTFTACVSGQCGTQEGVPLLYIWQAGVAVLMCTTSSGAADHACCHGLRKLLTCAQEQESVVCECPSLMSLLSTLSHLHGASALHVPGS